MTIPIIIFHLGNREYVEYCLRCALMYGNKKVILIHDNVNAYKHLPITVVHHKNYNQQVPLLEKLYVHLSTNSPQLEFICIQRWFCIYNYMKQHHIHRAFICDSDVLIFDNISKIDYKYFKQMDYMLCSSPSKNVTGGQGYWNQKVLENFIQFVIHFYQTQTTKMVEWFKTYQEPGGICDMTLLYYFVHKTMHFQGLRLPQYPVLKNDLTQVINNKFVFDLHIGAQGNHLYPKDYTMDIKYNIKQLCIKQYHQQYVPFIYNKRLRKRIRFVLLHFQGENKQWMITAYHKIANNN